MAPAEVDIFRLGIGSEQKKVHAGDAQKFETREIETDVACQGLDRTEVNFSGKDLSFIVRHGGGKVLTSGNVGEGKIKTFLRGEDDSVEIQNRRGGRMKITHTRHDGSTGEVGEPH